MKRVTFRVSKSGVYHYKDFTLNDKGLIKPQVVWFTWTKNEDCPIIEKESTVEEVLALLKDFAYGNRASIYKTDFLPTLVDESMVQTVRESICIIEKTIAKEANKLFKEHLSKILGKFKIESFDVLIYKDRKYVSLSQDTDKQHAVNYLCYKLLNGLGKVKYDGFDSEGGYIQNYLDYFIRDIEEAK